MPKTLIIVDGETESSFARMAFPQDQIRIVRCLSNGDAVTLDLVAQEIVETLELFGGDYDKAIVLWDRERRQESAEAIAADLAAKVNAAGNTRALIFGIKDVEIENWILADEEYVRGFAGAAYTYGLEGRKSKNALSAFFEESLSPQKKASMLLDCKASNIALTSPSFLLFQQQCTDPGWWWMYL